MSREASNRIPRPQFVIGWLFAIIFTALGILNFVYVHPVPGLFYLILGLAYFQSFDVFLHNRLGFVIPAWIRITVGLIILWATLAVGDLMEMFEAWWLH